MALYHPHMFVGGIWRPHIPWRYSTNISVQTMTYQDKASYGAKPPCTHMFVYVCIYMYVYIYICMYTSTYMCADLSTALMRLCIALHVPYNHMSAVLTCIEH